MWLNWTCVKRQACSWQRVDCQNQIFLEGGGVQTGVVVGRQMVIKIGAGRQNRLNTGPPRQPWQSDIVWLIAFVYIYYVLYQEWGAAEWTDDWVRWWVDLENLLVVACGQVRISGPEMMTHVSSVATTQWFQMNCGWKKGGWSSCCFN